MLFYFITSADEVEGGYVYGPVCLPVCLRARVCVCLFVSSLQPIIVLQCRSNFLKSFIFAWN